MASLSYNKRKGARFESDVATFLAARTGLPVERRHLAGADDRGDLSGVSVAGRPCVVECKNTAALDLAGHLREAEVERDNAGAAFGVVVQKRRGVSDAGSAFVIMTLETFADIVNAAQVGGLPTGIAIGI